MPSPDDPHTPHVVSVAELRAALTLARARGAGGGLTWEAAEWERLFARWTALQQRVVYLHVLVGHTLADTARQLGIARSSADAAWRRALARARWATPAAA
jgi:DNA-directed RNA polymerase specialized sigma24 family protein